VTRRVVSHRGRRLIVSTLDDRPRSAAARLRALVRGQVIDELTGRPIQVEIHVTCDRHGMHGRAAEGGLAGLVVVPLRVLPTLHVDNYVQEMTIEAEGFLPLTRQVTIAPQPAFPGTFAMVDLGLIPMHRRAVLIRGRVMRRMMPAGNLVPVAGATVSISEIWPQLPDPATPGVGLPPQLIAIQPPLHNHVAAGAGRVRRVQFTPAIDIQTLLEPATVGSDWLRLNNRAGLVVGALLAIDGGAADRLEYAEIVDVRGSVSATLAIRHEAGALARRVLVNTIGPDNPLNRDAYAGDPCVFLNSMTQLTTATAVAVDEGGPPADFYVSRLFAATTDADGDYALPAVSRLAQLRLRAELGPSNVATIVNPCYRFPENIFDLLLPP
jgi:hypothetical protein